MKTLPTLLPLPLLLLLLPACASLPSLTVDGRTGELADLAQVADRLKDKDVVFLGEQHYHSLGQDMQREIIQRLHTLRSEVVISLEMVTRDRQKELDAYLADEMSEEDFIKKGWTWKGWKTYGPILRYAKENGLSMIAANVPKKLEKRVSKEGLEAVAGEKYMPREVQTPKDAYWEAFVEVMKKHSGTEVKEGEVKEGEDEEGEDEEKKEKKMFRSYQVQCLWDDTMAESIADYLVAYKEVSREGERPPLIVHVCGNFHSDYRRGTVQRLLSRAPSLDVGIVSFTEAKTVRKPELEPGRADFVVVLREEPKKARPTGKPEPDAAAEKAEEAEEEDPSDVTARPGLGFMPFYEPMDEPGLMVQMVSPGGEAEKAGIKDKDVIIELDGEEIEDIRSYSDVLSSLEIGKVVDVVVLRQGKKVKLEVKVGRSYR